MLVCCCWSVLIKLIEVTRSSDWIFYTGRFMDEDLLVQVLSKQQNITQILLTDSIPKSEWNNQKKRCNYNKILGKPLKLNNRSDWSRTGSGGWNDPLLFRILVPFLAKQNRHTDEKRADVGLNVLKVDQKVFEEWPQGQMRGWYWRKVTAFQNKSELCLFHMKCSLSQLTGGETFPQFLFIKLLWQIAFWGKSNANVAVASVHRNQICVSTRRVWCKLRLCCSPCKSTGGSSLKGACGETVEKQKAQITDKTASLMQNPRRMNAV